MDHDTFKRLQRLPGLQATLNPYTHLLDLPWQLHFKHRGQSFALYEDPEPYDEAPLHQVSLIALEHKLTELVLTACPDQAGLDYKPGWEHWLERAERMLEPMQQVQVIPELDWIRQLADGHLAFVDEQGNSISNTVMGVMVERVTDAAIHGQLASHQVQTALEDVQRYYQNTQGGDEAISIPWEEYTAQKFQNLHAKKPAGYRLVGQLLPVEDA